MREPSGDHRGNVSGPVEGIRSRGWAPPASMIQISRAPDRSLENAMREPSGDHVGFRSSPKPHVSLVLCLVSKDSTKMCARVPQRVATVLGAGFFLDSRTNPPPI